MTTQDLLTPLRAQPFTEAIVKLEDLLSQSARAFLIGAGCSKCAGIPLTAELTDKVLAQETLDPTTKAILASIKDQFEGAPETNIEDYLSEVIDLLAISDRRAAKGASQTQVTIDESPYTTDQLRGASENIKKAIAEVIEVNVSIEVHQRFIQAVHRPLRPGMSGSNVPVEYLILNYDTLVEDALALERLPYADGLDGGTTGWWNPSTFDRDGLEARVLKLHGSIDWWEDPDDPLPRRIRASLSVLEAGDQRILIWPASTKYRETQLDPFAQLTERARRVLRPGLRSQRVLVTCGYRFGDSHINLEIDSALRESDGRLTVAAFTSSDVPEGKLKDWNEDPQVTNQVMIFGGRGFFHGKQIESSTEDLPWWKFENLARLLGGER